MCYNIYIVRLCLAKNNFLWKAVFLCLIVMVGILTTTVASIVWPIAPHVLTNASTNVSVKGLLLRRRYTLANSASPSSSVSILYKQSTPSQIVTTRSRLKSHSQTTPALWRSSTISLQSHRKPKLYSEG